MVDSILQACFYTFMVTAGKKTRLESGIRTFLFKPRRLPGFPPPKPRRKLSWEQNFILWAPAAVLPFIYLGAVRLADCTVTFILTDHFRHLSLEQLPRWQPPVCILVPVISFIPIARHFRLIERWLGQVCEDKDKKNRDV
jgi:hypothetical protein